MHHQGVGYISACVKHNYKQTIQGEYSILLGYDVVSLSNWIPGF